MNELKKIERANKELTNLSPTQEAELLFLIATFRSDYEIRKWATKHGVTLSPKTIRFYRNSPAWKAQVDRVRTDWGNKIFDFALSFKRQRIEEFKMLYEKLCEREDYDLAAKQLINIRHEVEGESGGKPNIYNLQYNQFMNLTDEELENQRLRCITELKRLKERFPNAISRLEEQRTEV